MLTLIEFLIEICQKFGQLMDFRLNFLRNSSKKQSKIQLFKTLLGSFGDPLKIANSVGNFIGDS